MSNEKKNESCTSVLVVIISFLAITIISNRIFNPLTTEQKVKYVLITSIVILSTYYLTIFIHELGHAIMGLLCGFSLKSLSVGLVVFKKYNGRFKLKLERKYNLQGSIMMNLKNTKNIKRKLCIMYSGGFLKNTISAMLCITLLINYKFSNKIITVIILFLGLFNILSSILFFIIRGSWPIYSDGFWVYNILKGSYYIDIITIPYYLLSGISLSDIKFTEKNTKSNEKIDITVDLFKYYHYLDKGTPINSLNILESINKRIVLQDYKVKEFFEQIIEMERLYLYSLLEDSETATIIYNRNKKFKTFNVPRAFAMYELMKTGNIDSTKSIYEKKYKGYKDPFNNCLKEFERKIARETFLINLN